MRRELVESKNRKRELGLAEGSPRAADGSVASLANRPDKSVSRQSKKRRRGKKKQNAVQTTATALGENSERSARFTPPSVVDRRQDRTDIKEDETAGLPNISSFRLLGHVAMLGDVTVEAGKWIGGPTAPSRIEGIAIFWPEKSPEFNVRYAVTVGTKAPIVGQFVEIGTFAGTKGRALPLVGINLEISGRAANSYELVADAVFWDAPPIRARGSRVFLSGLTGREPLVGLRVDFESVNVPTTQGLTSASVHGEDVTCSSAVLDEMSSQRSPEVTERQASLPAPVELSETTPNASTIFQVSEEDVRECYRLLLDREPDDQTSIHSLLGRPIEDVIFQILQSDEFQSRNIDQLVEMFDLFAPAKG